MTDSHRHTGCRWLSTSPADCEYRDTHHYCPHPEHACNCAELDRAASPSPTPPETTPHTFPKRTGMLVGWNRCTVCNVEEGSLASRKPCAAPSAPRTEPQHVTEINASIDASLAHASEHVAAFLRPRSPSTGPTDRCDFCSHERNEHLEGLGCTHVQKPGGGYQGQQVIGCGKRCEEFVEPPSTGPTPSEEPEDDGIEFPEPVTTTTRLVPESALRATLAEAQRPNVCGVCGGAPLASGRQCVCRGIGTEVAESEGLRLELHDMEQRLAEAQQERDGLAAMVENLSDALAADPAKYAAFIRSKEGK